MITLIKFPGKGVCIRNEQSGVLIVTVLNTLTLVSFYNGE